jgi:glycine/D-amino acid oxidase-like deaminating enzyme
MPSRRYDFTIVGAGIAGLTVAREIKQRAPVATIVILNKEDRPGMYASGRNSGVLPCGIYYGNDTLKAKVCARGASRLMALSDENTIIYCKSGKEVAYHYMLDYFAAARKLYHSLLETDLLRTAKVDIRSQLVNNKTQNLEMDYVFERTGNSLHLLNASSPTFTSFSSFAHLILEKSGIAGFRKEAA